jgi:hypothetical protein
MRFRCCWGLVGLVDSDGSQAGGRSIAYPPGISADGAWVAFASSATDLVPLDYNDENDVFVRRWR